MEVTLPYMLMPVSFASVIYLLTLTYESYVRSVVYENLNELVEKMTNPSVKMIKDMGNMTEEVARCLKTHTTLSNLKMNAMKTVVDVVTSEEFENGLKTLLEMLSDDDTEENDNTEVDNNTESSSNEENSFNTGEIYSLIDGLNIRTRPVSSEENIDR